jgi:NAD(P)H-hydrate repair Nnr-like enzyme with NAD(P)H-hydrate epimerase domain
MGGIPEAALMEEAGAGAAAVVRQFCQGAGVALVYAGKGHNAGDAFVLAGHLLDEGWRVEVRTVFPGESMRPLAVEKLAALRALSTEAFAAIDVAIDGHLKGVMSAKKATAPSGRRKSKTT